MKLAIASDQPATTALLGEIARLCAAHGARWHPQLQVEVNGGAMRLLAPPDTTGELIKLPTELLLPIGAAQWSQSADALQLLQPPPAATAVQRELLQLHVELYNATGKVHWWSSQHPGRLVDASATAIAATCSI